MLRWGREMLSKISFSAFTDELMKIAYSPVLTPEQQALSKARGKERLLRQEGAQRNLMRSTATDEEVMAAGERMARSRRVLSRVAKAHEPGAAQFAKQPAPPPRATPVTPAAQQTALGRRQRAPSMGPSENLPPSYATMSGTKVVASPPALSSTPATPSPVQPQQIAPQAPVPQQAAQPSPQTQSAPKKGGRGGGRARAPARGGQAVGKLEQAATRGGTLRRLGAVAAKHPLLAMGGMGAMGLAGGMGAMGMRHPAQQ